MSTQLTVGGQWLNSIGAWGDLHWEHEADGGCSEITWKMDLPPTFTHPALRRNQPVQVKIGPGNVCAGILADPTPPTDDEGWTFTAHGAFALAQDYLCFDGSHNTTSTPDTAIDTAISDGLTWTRPDSILATPFGSGTDATDSLNSLGSLLDAYADSAGQRWGVDADLVVYSAADPTVPTWHLTPGSGRFGLADDNYASDLYGRYLASGAGYATAHVSDTAAKTNWGYKAFGVDLTSLGLITSGAATTALNGLLAKGAARLAFTSGVEVTKWQLTTPGGTPASLPLVKGQQLVRMFGIPDEQGQTVPYVDWVIGNTSYDAGASTIGLSPVGLAERTLGDVLTVGAA